MSYTFIQNLSLFAAFLIPIISILGWFYGIRAYRLLGLLLYGEHKFPIFNTGDKNTIFLTIDDIPWSYKLFGYELKTCIDEICQIIDENKSSATLMTIGKNLHEADPKIIECLKKYNKKGIIEFSNHGDTNSKHYNFSNEDLKEEIQLCEKSIQEKLEVPCVKFFRPGHGMFHKEMINECAKLNYKIVLGDVYSFDPQVPLWFLNLFHIFCTVREGSIIIIHDRPWTPTLLRWLLPMLKSRNYKISKLSDSTKLQE